MLADFRFIFIWWLTIFCLGIFSFPLIFLIFKNFFDRGYIFSKIFTPIILCFFLLLFGVLKILPFSNLSISILLLILFLVNSVLLIKNKNYLKLVEFLKSNYKIIIFEEVIFFIILTIWSFVRGFAPSIEGLEKYMDWGFINSILRSDFLPPKDMWFANLPINYYYFGHLFFALLTKISGINSAITYNLSIATVCALTFVSTFSLAGNLVFSLLNRAKKEMPLSRHRGIKGRVWEGFGFRKVILAGLISAFLLTFGGNLHTVSKIIQSQKETSNFSNYWYPDATRFIGYDPETNDKTIHEFPLYSFVVADLHGHMNDIPVVLFFMAFLFNSLLIAKKKTFDWFFIIFSGFLLSIQYMTNAWDFAIYGILLAVFTFLKNYQNNQHTFFYKTILTGILIIIFWFIFSLPFSANFTPMTQGIKLTDSHSIFHQVLILYGGFWLFSLPFYLYSCFTKKLSTSDIFVLSLVLTATILVLIPEFVYLKDIYIYEHRRANTMFKLTYQAFIMYSLTSGYIFICLSQIKSKIWSSIFKVLFSIVLVSHLIYPYFAIKSYYSFKKYEGLNGLDYLRILYPNNFEAINWINQNISGQPVMLEAVGDSYTTFNQVSISTGLPTIEGWIVHEWLWRGGYDQPSVRQQEVEKVYKYLSSDSKIDDQDKTYIVSSGDNLWNIAKKELNNEFLWNEIAKINNINNPSIIHPNQKLILPVEIPQNKEKTSSNAISFDEVKEILSKYYVKYIFVGDKEYEKYGQIDINKFENLGAHLVFQSGKTSIFQL